MGIEDYETLDICKLMNVTELGWHLALHLTPMGDGFGRAKLLGSAAGLHKWTLSADAISDYDDRSIEDQPYFTHLLEFIKRHVRLNNKPFIMRDPRTDKYYMASFVEPRADFRWITQKLFAGGLQVEQRRVKDVEFNADGSIATPDVDPPTVPVIVSFEADSASELTLTWLASTDDIAVAGYEVAISADNNTSYGSWIDVGDVLTYQFTGLDDDTLHYAKARAYDAAGNRSAASAEVSATTDELPPFTNWALAGNGSTATASSTVAFGTLSPSKLIDDGLRHTNGDWANNGWETAGNPSGGTPEWVEIDLGASRNIEQIDVIGLASAIDYATDPVMESDTSNFSLASFTVDYWNGSSWVTVGTRTTDNIVWRRFTFAPVSTDLIRVHFTSGATGVNNHAFLVAIEAWGY